MYRFILFKNAVAVRDVEIDGNTVRKCLVVDRRREQRAGPAEAGAAWARAQRAGRVRRAVFLCSVMFISYVGW